MSPQPGTHPTNRKGYRPLTVISLAVPFLLLAGALLTGPARLTAAQTGCNITLETYQLNYQTDRQMLLTVTNGSTSAVTITAMGFNWTPPPDRLMEISIPAGVRVYTGNNTPPVIADITDTPIAGGATATIELRFDDPVATFGSALAVGFQTDQGLCFFTFTPGTAAPDAQSDSAQTTPGTPVTIDVAANDSDPDANLDPTTVSIDTAPLNGGAVPGPAAGSVTYTPGPGFEGVDIFVYSICDTGGLCDTAAVTVTVSAINTPPTAADDSASTDEDTAVIIDVLANDSDPEGGLAPSTVSVISPPSSGTATPNGNGTVTYTPAANFNGTDSFTYQVCDTVGACDSALVTIAVNAVNDPPIATPDSATTGHATPVTIAVLDNDTDIDSALNPASVTVTGAPGGGSTAVNTTTGAITYMPSASFSGTDTFTYRVCDVGGLCASAQVSVSVAAPPTPVPPTPVPPTPVPPTPTSIPTTTSVPPSLPIVPGMPTRSVTPTGPASTPAPTDSPPTATPAPPEPAAPPMPQDAPPVASSAGLEVSKVASDEEAAPGGVVIFTTTLRNTGTVTLNEVMLVDALGGDAALTLVTISRGQLSVTAGGIEWLVGSLGPGETVVIEVQALMDAEAQGQVSSCGTASADQIEGITACQYIAIQEGEAGAPDAGKEPAPRPEPGIVGPSAPQPEMPGLDGLQMIGDRCVVIFGATLTCIPAMRWLLLITGLLALGLGLWFPLWRRFREDEDDEEIIIP